MDFGSTVILLEGQENEGMEKAVWPVPGLRWSLEV